MDSQEARGRRLHSVTDGCSDWRHTPYPTWGKSSWRFVEAQAEGAAFQCACFCGGQADLALRAARPHEIDALPSPPAAVEDGPGRKSPFMPRACSDAKEQQQPLSARQLGERRWSRSTHFPSPPAAVDDGSGRKSPVAPRACSDTNDQQQPLSARQAGERCWSSYTSWTEVANDHANDFSGRMSLPKCGSSAGTDTMAEVNLGGSALVSPQPGAAAPAPARTCLEKIEHSVVSLSPKPGSDILPERSSRGAVPRQSMASFRHLNA